MNLHSLLQYHVRSICRKAGPLALLCPDRGEAKRAENGYEHRSIHLPRTRLNKGFVSSSETRSLITSAY